MAQQELMPDTQTFPSQNQEVWSQLSELPTHCILYGSTAISLHTGCEESPPALEFKTRLAFDADELKHSY
jgi:hypothetical protein